MAKVDHTADARVLVGVDISKHRHEVLIAVPGKTRRRRMTITNTTGDFMRLIAILREYGLPVRIGQGAKHVLRQKEQMAFIRVQPGKPVQTQTKQAHLGRNTKDRDKGKRGLHRGTIKRDAQLPCPYRPKLSYLNDKWHANFVSAV